MDGGSLADLVLNGGCRSVQSVHDDHALVYLFNYISLSSLCALRSDEEVLSDIAEQVLHGLQFLHDNRQMHRDLKPGNILLNCKGQVKLADFGISRALDGTAGFANSFVGTVTYMSPERIVGENYSYPSDIW